MQSKNKIQGRYVTFILERVAHTTLDQKKSKYLYPIFENASRHDKFQVTRGSRQSPFTPQELQEITDEADVDEALAMVHEMIRSHLWYKNDVLQDRLRKPLMKLCAQYLYQEKHRGLALNGVGMTLFYPYKQ